MSHLIILQKKRTWFQTVQSMNFFIVWVEHNDRPIDGGSGASALQATHKPHNNKADKHKRYRKPPHAQVCPIINKGRNLGHILGRCESGSGVDHVGGGLLKLLDDSAGQVLLKSGALSPGKPDFKVVGVCLALPTWHIFHRVHCPWE